MANGNFGGGDGTVNNPFLVEDAYDLDAIRQFIGDSKRYFIQVNDIDMSGFGNFVPIGNGYGSNAISIDYNGMGHKIYNLYIDNSHATGSQESKTALFGSVKSSSSISNLGIENCNIIGTYATSFANTAPLVAYENDKTIITNCYATGTVKGGGAGGLVGDNSNLYLENCYSSCDVYTNAGGGIAYRIDSGEIKNCFALNKRIVRTSGTSSSFGDLFGVGNPTIINCYSLDTLEFVEL